MQSFDCFAFSVESELRSRCDVFTIVMSDITDSTIAIAFTIIVSFENFTHLELYSVFLPKSFEPWLCSLSPLHPLKLFVITSR